MSTMTRSFASLAAAAVLALGGMAVSTAASAQTGAQASDQASMDSQQPVNDTWITTKVKTKLTTTDGVDAMNISVDTVNGVVYLTGSLASDVEKKKAVAAAKSIQGVKQVDSSGLMIAD